MKLKHHTYEKGINLGCLKFVNWRQNQAAYATSTSKVQLSPPPPPPAPGHLNHMTYQYLYNISGQITTVKPLLTDTSVYHLDTSLSWI